MLLDLFPLNSVVFPHQKMTLRIFEPRYLKLIEACHKDARSFGVCMISEGNEVGAPAIPFKVGSSVVITEFIKVTNDFIYIVVQGERRFRIEHFIQEQPHIIVEIEWLDDVIPSFPGDYPVFRNLVTYILKDTSKIPKDNNEFFGLLGEILNVHPMEKQKILELSNEEVVPALIRLLESL